MMGNTKKLFDKHSMARLVKPYKNFTLGFYYEYVDTSDTSVDIVNDKGEIVEVPMDYFIVDPTSESLWKS